MPTASRLRACPSCGAGQRGRCDRCGWAGKATRIHTAAWQQRSRRILASWRAAHGDWCPGWPPVGHGAHSTADLTVHHITEDPEGATSVLCRPMNSALGAPEHRSARP